MTKLTKESGIIYEFNQDNTPIKNVTAGTTLTIETYDCFTNQIQSEDSVMEQIDWNKVNPATGPVFVDGALPGDILKVKIEKIKIADQGVMAVVPELGLAGDLIDKIQAEIMPVENEHVIFNEVEAPITKMIGVIGVAPKGNGVNCGIPGTHGGNMDNTMVKEGATLYFPVAVEGALFALGDLHAAMGDGEVSGSGVEIPGEVTVTLDVIKREKLIHPMLENEDSFSQIVSAETLDEAIDTAGLQMIERIVERTGLSTTEVAMLMSMVGQAEICQIVNPLKTARYVVPKWLLKKLDVQLIKE